MKKIEKGKKQGNSGSALLHIAVDKDLHKQFKVLCYTNDLSMTEVLSGFIKDFVKRGK